MKLPDRSADTLSRGRPGRESVPASPIGRRGLGSRERSPSQTATTEAICASGPNRERPGLGRMTVSAMGGQRQARLD